VTDTSGILVTKLSQTSVTMCKLIWTTQKLNSPKTA